MVSILHISQGLTPPTECAEDDAVDSTIIQIFFMMNRSDSQHYENLKEFTTPTNILPPLLKGFSVYSIPSGSPVFFFNPINRIHSSKAAQTMSRSAETKKKHLSFRWEGQVCIHNDCNNTDQALNSILCTLCLLMCLHICIFTYTYTCV